MRKLTAMKVAPSVWIGALCLLALAAIVYVPSLDNGFVWDDDQYVAMKAGLTGIGGLAKIWTDPYCCPQYYPITHSTLWLNYTLSSMDPRPYHVLNIFLHGLCGVLIFLILRRLSVPGAWLAAAFFVVHPVSVESVAWVTERKNVLSGAFFFASALAYLYYARVGRDSSDDGSAGRRSRKLYALSLALFVCALLSKTAICPLPVVLLLTVWWKKKTKLAGQDVYPLIPFFALAVGMGLVTTLVEKQIGASGSHWNLTMLEKTLVAGRSLWFYADKDIWPSGIMFVYPRWALNPGSMADYLYPVTVLVTVAVLWLRRRDIGKGPLVAALYFVVMAAPALGFINIYFQRYSFVQDHFQYFAMLGVVTAGACLLAKGMESDASHSSAERLRRSACAVASIAILIAMATVSWGLQGKYFDEESLWRSSIKSNPTAAIPHLNLGVILLNRGDLEEAGGEFGLGLKLGRDYPEAWCDYGRWLDASGKSAQAIRYYQKSLEMDPTSVTALTNLAVAHYSLEQLGEAEKAARRAVGLRDKTAAAETILGAILARRGNRDEAIAHFRAAVRLDPNNPYLKANLDKMLNPAAP